MDTVHALTVEMAVHPTIQDAPAIHINYAAIHALGEAMHIVQIMTVFIAMVIRKNTETITVPNLQYREMLLAVTTQLVHLLTVIHWTAQIIVLRRIFGKQEIILAQEATAITA